MIQLDQARTYQNDTTRGPSNGRGRMSQLRGLSYQEQKSVLSPASNTQTGSRTCPPSGAELKPAQEQTALHNLGLYLGPMARKHGKTFNFAPFKEEYRLGRMMSQLMSLQSNHTRSKVDAKMSFKRPADRVVARHFASVTIAGKSPRDWYQHIGGLSAIGAADRRQMQVVVWAASTLRAYRDSIAGVAADRESAAHGVTGKFNIVQTQVTYLRAAAHELANRSPHNIMFDESRFSVQLQKATCNNLTRKNLPRTIDPLGAKPDIKSFKAFAATPRSWGDVLANNSSLGAKQRWLRSVDSSSLRYVLRSAKRTLPSTPVDATLKGAGLTARDLR